MLENHENTKGCLETFLTSLDHNSIWKSWMFLFLTADMKIVIIRGLQTNKRFQMQMFYFFSIFSAPKVCKMFTDESKTELGVDLPCSSFENRFTDCLSVFIYQYGDLNNYTIFFGVFVYVCITMHNRERKQYFQGNCASKNIKICINSQKTKCIM